MEALPSDVCNAVVYLIRQNKTAGIIYCLKNKNVALPKYGIKVIAGGRTSFIEDKAEVAAPESNTTRTRELISDDSPSLDAGLLKHTIGSSEGGIKFDLGHRFMLNVFKMQLIHAENQTFSYWIDVSEDSVNWTRVIDHSKYPCSNLQYLYFEPRPVRYIRICGTAPVDGTFEISRFEAFYSTDPLIVYPDILSIPLIKRTMFKHKTHTEYTSEGPFKRFAEVPHLRKVYLKGIKVQLAQPCLFNNIEVAFRDNNVNVPALKYNIDVSPDGNNWTRVFSRKNVTEWHKVPLNKCPAVFF
uniref:F5/8 type C domain-containing protein n=1 Tax=Panagrellus redivivus TaxID=6233 RepID=A0A7E4UUQ8_PANRE